MSNYLKAQEELSKRVDRYVTATQDGDKLKLDVAANLVGELVFGKDFDDVVYTNPTSTTKNIELKLGVTTIANYEITYTDSSKCEVSRIRKL